MKIYFCEHLVSCTQDVDVLSLPFNEVELGYPFYAYTFVVTRNNTTLSSTCECSTKIAVKSSSLVKPSSQKARSFFVDLLLSWLKKQAESMQRGKREREKHRGQ